MKPIECKMLELAPNAKDIMHINAILIQPNMHVNSDEDKIEIDITNTHNELNNWIERIGKTANEICNDPNYNRIKLKTSDNGRHIGFIIESNDAGALGCIGWAIERHLDVIPAKLKPTFQKIVEDTKTRKDNLERS
jgi:hypothetical protein